MRTLSNPIRYLLALLLIAAVVAAFWLGKSRLDIDSDVTSALPQKDPVVAAARLILHHHPALENIFIDLSQDEGLAGRNALADAADRLIDNLNAGGLVKVVSETGVAEFMPQLFDTVVDNLPLFFSEQDLAGPVGKLVDPAGIEEHLSAEYRRLYEMDNIGQAEYLSSDPLGLRNLIFARLAQAAPFQEATLYRGHIFTKDWRHLLVIAEPLTAAQDTAFARRLTAMLKETADTLPVKMVYAGAFRAALDNEEIIKRDTRKALILVTVGLSLLVLLCFRRSWLGLLAVLPAVAGALLAVFTYSLFKSSIFAISLGFAGALVSITVDHGLAYVLSLDRPYETRGRKVSHEVWSVTSFTVYTTVVALLSLTLSGIPLFQEVGLFAAMGVGLAAVFVHIFFPLVFPRLKPARRPPRIPMDRLMTRLTSFSNWKTVAAAGVFALVMLFFARLDFNADLAAMNTVRPETLAAEKVINQTWGKISGQAYILTQGRTIDRLWHNIGQLTDFLQEEETNGVLDRAVPRAAVFPGPGKQKNNLTAWKGFWTDQRRRKTAEALFEAGEKLGFTEDAFQPFLEMIENPGNKTLALPEGIFGALGVYKDREDGGWLLVESVTPGSKYQAEDFFHQAYQAGYPVFDGAHFSSHLAERLNTSFVKMLAIIGLAAMALLFFLFVDWQLLLLAFTPLAFSLIATLGTLGVLGIPLAIPSLMLAPVVVGLGMDYGLYLVRSRQRFGRADHPATEAFRAAVLLGGLSTLIGMGSLALSQHQVLKSAGFSTFLGIAYAMIGTFVIIPPFLNRIFRDKPLPQRKVVPGSKAHRALALERYRHLEPNPRMYARFKMLWDPMFPRLADFINPKDTIIDLGCGFGIPAVWLLAIYPDLYFHSLEPSAERVRVATRALGDRATVNQGLAQDLETMGPPRADAAMMLDMAHYLPDRDLANVLARLHERLSPGGRLILRTTVPSDGRNKVWLRRLELFRLYMAGLTPHFRTKDEIISAMTSAGFEIEMTERTAVGREEIWFIGRC